MQLSSRTAILAIGLTLACGGSEEETPMPADEPITLAGVGFNTPESVRHDPVADVYLVSNINGDPFAEDGNGFISRVSPSGDVLQLKWIDGEAEGVTLNAPKGLGIVADVLYVTDINQVRMFNRETGAPIGELAIPGSTFLNDIAATGDGGIYITDSGANPGFVPSGSDAVYRLSATGDLDTLIANSELGGPNGVTASGGTIWVNTFRSGELYQLSDGSVVDPTPIGEGALDGLEVHDGQIYVSSWNGQAVLRGAPGGEFEVLVSGVPAPADFGIDAQRNRLLIPLFEASEVRIIPIASASGQASSP